MKKLRKTKTAMQELIENLEITNKAYYKKWKESKGSEKEKWDNAMSVLTISIMVAKKLLPKEKQNIIEARINNDSSIRNAEEAETYYNEKYIK